MYNDASLSMNGENSDSMLCKFFLEMCVLNKFWLHKPRSPRPTLFTKQVGISYFEKNSPTLPTFYQLTKMLF